MKAILVMDMPDNCGACKLSSGDGFHLMCPFAVRGIEAYIKTRYEGCPLREQPEEMEVCGKYPQPGKAVPSYRIGWNDCLKAIADIKET